MEGKEDSEISKGDKGMHFRKGVPNLEGQFGIATLGGKLT